MPPLLYRESAEVSRGSRKQPCVHVGTAAQFLLKPKARSRKPPLRSFRPARQILFLLWRRAGGPPLIFAGITTTVGAPSLRPLQGWVPRTHKSGGVEIELRNHTHLLPRLNNENEAKVQSEASPSRQRRTRPFKKNARTGHPLLRQCQRTKSQRLKAWATHRCNAK